jgi:hypothetical protein
MAKPTEKFHWAITAIPGFEIIEPPNNKKDIGWLSQEKPPYQFFNWLFNVLGQWLEYIDLELDPKADAVVPIGTILPFYDFDGAVTFNPDLFSYCDGSVINDADSPLDGMNLPDLSNRYLVGFGTEGGEDIDSDPWNAAAVGNANHQINLQHSHTVNAHTHDLANHTHTGPSHTHASGTLKFEVGDRNDVGAINLRTFGGTPSGVTNINSKREGVDPAPIFNYHGPLTSAAVTWYTDTGSGSTASGGNSATGTPSNNTSGSASPGMNNQLSATQSIQVRSVRVRFIMRYK